MFKALNQKDIFDRLTVPDRQEAARSCKEYGVIKELSHGRNKNNTLPLNSICKKRTGLT